ncbi:hypothetical protein ACFYVV_37900 [Streptomyces tendae]|uniref:hypothetical protein n=1 Tax=Streptomyces tendae TaxID=1932 RepID=UPI00369A618C
MWAFHHAQPSPESETALRAAEKSLQQAKAHHPEVEAKCRESRRVKEQFQRIVFGQRPSAAS